ncbi:MAG: hypothetical protein ACYC2U_08825, partial [Candidatus Amoebophilus sp.]
QSKFQSNPSVVVLQMISPGVYQAYPGTLNIAATGELIANNLEYSSTSFRSSVVSLSTLKINNLIIKTDSHNSELQQTERNDLCGYLKQSESLHTTDPVIQNINGQIIINKVKVKPEWISETIHNELLTRDVPLRQNMIISEPKVILSILNSKIRLRKTLGALVAAQGILLIFQKSYPLTKNLGFITCQIGIIIFELETMLNNTN